MFVTLKYYLLHPLLSLQTPLYLLLRIATGLHIESFLVQLSRCMQSFLLSTDFSIDFDSIAHDDRLSLLIFQVLFPNPENDTD